MAIIGGHRYYVDAKGNIFKDDKFVPAQNFQYIPSSVISEARFKKSAKNTVKPEVTVVSSETVVSNPGTSTTNTPTQQGTVTSGGNGTLGGGGISINPIQLGQTIPNVVQSGVSNFGFMAIVAVGGLFVVSSILSSFRRAR